MVRKSFWYKAVTMLLLVAVTLTVYHPVFNYGFISYDDPAHVYDNPNIAGGLSLHSIHWAFTSTLVGNWIPLTSLSYLIDISLFGMNPGKFHATNVVLHCINGCLLFLFLERTTSAIFKSAVVAALFLIHPLHVESVAWISERKDVLSTLFFMLTLLAYRRYATVPAFAAYMAVTFCFILGLLSKPMLVTLPLVLLLIDYWPLQRVSGLDDLKKCLFEKIPLFIISAIFCLIVLKSQGDAVVSTIESSYFDNFKNATVAYSLYLFKLVVPRNLVLQYPFMLHLEIWRPLLSSIFLSAITITSIKWYRNRPYILFGWFWYLTTLVPVIGLIRVGAQSMADRYTYIPSIGFFILVVWSGATFLHGNRKRAVTALAVFTIVIYCLLSYRQIGYWKDTATLFSRSVSLTNNNYVAMEILGTEYLRLGELARAKQLLEKSLEIFPGNHIALLNLGRYYITTGDTNSALNYISKSIQEKPQYADAHLHLGYLMLYTNNIPAALYQQQILFALNPKLAATLQNYIALTYQSMQTNKP